MMPAKKRLFDLRFSILLGLQLLILVAIALYFIKWKPQKNELSSDYWRDVASRLHSTGITLEAAKYYEKYLEEAQIDAKTRAKIAFSIAELYEREEMAEKALSWYYQVEVSDAAESDKKGAAKRIVALLEKLEKFSAAKYALKGSTQLNPNQERAKGAVPVAKIGDREIFLHEIHEAIDTLPPQLKKSFESDEAKADFLKKYVADELLYLKAKRLQYDNNPDIQKN